MKMCRKCKVEKPDSEYYKANKGKNLFPECKECSRARAREWARLKRASDPEYCSNAKLKQIWGMSPEDYEKKKQEQGGVCAICKDPLADGGRHSSSTDRRRRLHVDHDHVTGKIRGLLCSTCNTSIGSMRDDPELLNAASRYILSYRDVLGEVV